MLTEWYARRPSEGPWHLPRYRRLGIRFGAAHGEVEVNLGPTRALAVCSGEIVVPSGNRPREGRINFYVEWEASEVCGPHAVRFGPLASPSFEVGRPSPQAVAVGNFVERLLRGSSNKYIYIYNNNNNNKYDK